MITSSRCQFTQHNTFHLFVKTKSELKHFHSLMMYLRHSGCQGLCKKQQGIPLVMLTLMPDSFPSDPQPSCTRSTGIPPSSRRLSSGGSGTTFPPGSQQRLWWQSPASCPPQRYSCSWGTVLARWACGRTWKSCRPAGCSPSYHRKKS